MRAPRSRSRSPTARRRGCWRPPEHSDGDEEAPGAKHRPRPGARRAPARVPPAPDSCSTARAGAHRRKGEQGGSAAPAGAAGRPLSGCDGRGGRARRSWLTLARVRQIRRRSPRWASTGSGGRVAAIVDVQLRCRSTSIRRSPLERLLIALKRQERSRRREARVSDQGARTIRSRG